jgi:hypothetical protein
MLHQNGRSAPPSAGKSREELTRIAYDVLEGIEFLEMNDGNRLGYHLYLYLDGQLPSVAEAIYESKSRTSVSPKELERIISQRLAEAGVMQA